MCILSWEGLPHFNITRKLIVLLSMYRYLLLFTSTGLLQGVREGSTTQAASHCEGKVLQSAS